MGRQSFGLTLRLSCQDRCARRKAGHESPGKVAASDWEQPFTPSMLTDRHVEERTAETCRGPEQNGQCRRSVLRWSLRSVSIDLPADEPADQPRWPRPSNANANRETGPDIDRSSGTDASTQASSQSRSDLFEGNAAGKQLRRVAVRATTTSLENRAAGNFEHAVRPRAREAEGVLAVRGRPARFRPRREAASKTPSRCSAAGPDKPFAAAVADAPG